MNKFKIILKTSHKNYNRVENCLDTWLKDLDYICITDIITGRFNEISCSNDDSYNSNEEKTVNFFNIVKNSTDFDSYDWLFFIDDDAYLNVNYLYYLLPYLEKEKFYGLTMYGYPKNPKIPFPSGGSGYIVSPSMIKSFSSISKPDYTLGGAEDFVVGNWLYENNQSISQTVFINGNEHFFKLNGWWPFHREERILKETSEFDTNYKKIIIDKIVDNQTEELLNNHLTHHYIREKFEMEYIHSILKNWNINCLV